MAIQIFNTPEVQDFLRLASGLNQSGGNPRAKQIVHRLLSDLFKAIDDLDITSDEYWAGVAYLNTLGARGEAGLLSPGLGLDHFLDMRMDAKDKELGVENGTPRTIEGPLYVAGAPEAKGFARLDDGSDKAGHTLIMHGTVYSADGKPMPNAKVEVWHANTKGFYSHYDPTGEQKAFNMRRTIITDDPGQSHLNGDAQEAFQIAQTPPRPLALGLQANLHRGVILEHLQRHASEHRLVVRTLILV